MRADSHTAKTFYLLDRTRSSTRSMHIDGVPTRSLDSFAETYFLPEWVLQQGFRSTRGNMLPREPDPVANVTPLRHTAPVLKAPA